MSTTNYAVDQLVTDALTVALKADVCGVGIYDHAIDLLIQCVTPSPDDTICTLIIKGNNVLMGEYDEAICKLKNLREAWTADEVKWMLNKAPLKQGDVRDGVVE